MLERVTLPVGDTSKLLARFELMDGDEKIELEFTLCNDDYLRGLDIDPIFNKEMVSFDVFPKKERLLSSLEKSDAEIEEEFYNHHIDTDPSLSPHEKQAMMITLASGFHKYIEERNKLKTTIPPLSDSISESLTLKKQHYITTYSCNGNAIGLLCRSSNVNKSIKDIQNILTALSKQVFLSAPPTQIYLFLDEWTKELLFKKRDVKRNRWIDNYESKLDEVKNKLPNFLTFDVFAIDIVVSLIEQARNQDFKTFVDTGTNGTSYQKTIEELNLLTQGKKVLPQLDGNAAITGIVFKTNDGIDIYPEDLSHGELKRLSIYVWLKTLPKGENIVLMDEIENALHPDWQYQIVRDLVEWGKNNQYILATHSYELCNALTPAHVKELEPKLIANKR
jgi:hypothetical protein